MMRKWSEKKYPTAKGTFSFFFIFNVYYDHLYDYDEKTYKNPLMSSSQIFCFFEKEYFSLLFYLHIITTSPYQRRIYDQFIFFNFSFEILKKKGLSSTKSLVEKKKKRKSKRGSRRGN
jgi:hypothetical protein